MALTANPTLIRILNLAAGNANIAVSTTNAGPISATLTDGSFVTLSPTSIAGVSGTFTLTPISRNGGDDLLTITDGVDTVKVPIALGASVQLNSPANSDFTLGKLSAYIRIKCDAPVNPTADKLGLLINQAILEVGDALNPGFSTVALPLAFGSSTFTLPADVSEFTEIAYYAGGDQPYNNIRYEIVEVGAGQFIDFANGVGSNLAYSPMGPVLIMQRISDTGGRIRLEFSPNPPPGNLVLTYRPRMSFFDLGSADSTTSMDPAYYKLVVLLTCQEVAESQRDFRRAQSFQQQYEALLQRKKETLGRRNRNNGAQVRDVMSENYNPFPSWYPGN